MIETLLKIWDMVALPVQNSVLAFSLLLIIIIVSSIVQRNFHVPSIVMLIVMGIIVGPNGVGLIARSQAIDLFSTIGLLYIMFIVGLDLDLNEFQIHKYKSMLYGLLTFSLPLVMGYSVSKYILGVETDGAMLIACVFATHTIILYPAVSKMGVQKDISVAVTVGGTIITDTAALILLAFVMEHHAGHMDILFLVRMIIVGLILSVVIFKVFPYLLKWFFKHLENEKGSHFILVLSIMFLSSYLAQLGGFEPIIGAFLAGLAINRLIPSTSTLMNRIDFLGNSLFIPIFLINVGLMMDFHSVIGDWHVIFIALVLTFASLLSKWGAVFVTQKVFKFTGDQRRLMFGLSGCRASATIAVMLVGANVGLISENVLNSVVVIILLTCTVSAFLVDKAARNIAFNAEREIDGVVAKTEKGVRVYQPETENVLVTVALETEFERLIDFALLLKERRAATPLLIGTVLHNTETDDAEERVRSTRERLQKYVKNVSASDVNVTVLTTLDFNMSNGIVRLTREAMADIIIMGWPRKMGFLDKLLGANAGGVVGRTNKMVMMCRIERQMILHRNIVLLVPPHAELEVGFKMWVRKVVKLSNELTLPILLLCNAQTRDAINEVIHRKVGRITYREFDKWDSLLQLKKLIRDDDLIVVVSSRNGLASYQSSLDQIPVELEIRFATNDSIIIYPQYGEKTVSLVKA